MERTYAMTAGQWAAAYARLLAMEQTAEHQRLLAKIENIMLAPLYARLSPAELNLLIDAGMRFALPKDAPKL